MGTRNTVLHRIREQTPPHSEATEEELREGLYIFVSFDLVNSTAFKGESPKHWKTIVTKFYDLVVGEFQPEKELSPFSLWKFVGDEVLLRAQVHSAIAIKDYTASLYEGFNNIIDSLSAFVRQHFSDGDIATPQEVAIHSNSDRYAFMLGVKATAWTAYCQGPLKSEENSRLESIRIPCYHSIGCWTGASRFPRP